MGADEFGGFDVNKFSQMMDGAVPKEALEYAASTLPDVDDKFFKVYRQRFAPGKHIQCPVCSHAGWVVSPFLGLLISLRGAGPMGNFPTKDIFVAVKCDHCKYTMLFDVREELERIKNEAEAPP